MRKIFQALFLITLTLLNSSCASQNDVGAAKNPPAEKIETAPAEEVKPEEKFKPVVISFAGDCTLGSFSGAESDFEYYWRHGPEYYLGNVKPIFAADDITFVNLEGPLTNNPQTAIKQFTIRGEPKYVEILTAGSVEMCNLSNNHIYDCGAIGFKDTVNLLIENGINFCGEGYSDLVEVRGMKIGFLGYQGWENTPDLREKISADIKNLRDKKSAEVVVVEFHWGGEKEYFSDEIQDAIAHFTIDSGADIVVGAHPHVMQGIELYKGKIIAYSLGNFCFGANVNPSDKETFILQASIDRRGENIFITPKIIPCRISSTAAYNDFCPTFVTGQEAELILEHLAKSSKIYPKTIDFE